MRAFSGGVAFRALKSFAADYGGGDTKAIRQSLGLTWYTSHRAQRKELSANGEKAMEQAVDTLPTGVRNIELQDLTNTVNVTLASTERAETVLDEELTSEQSAALATANDPPLYTAWVSQAKRELAGLGQAMTRKRDKLTNNLGKLSALDEEISGLEDHLALERPKISETNDKDLQQEIQKCITDLEKQLSDKQPDRGPGYRQPAPSKRILVVSYHGSARPWHKSLRVTRYWLIGSAPSFNSRTRDHNCFYYHRNRNGYFNPSSGPDWQHIRWKCCDPTIPTAIRQRWPSRVDQNMLQALGHDLAILDGKAAAALPGVIGSDVSWLLGTLRKATGWLSEPLWALVMDVAGLLFMSAHEFLSPQHPKHH